MKLKIGIILIFLGSVFLTSEKFVNTQNAVKFYITVFALFVGVIILLFGSRNIKLAVQETTSLSVLKGLYFVGVFQSLYGVLQYVGKYPSNHNSFAVTGSFDNPAGFVAVLSLLFPIGIFWCIKSKRLEHRLVFFSV
jgi:O-antigen polymerase